LSCHINFFPAVKVKLIKLTTGSCGFTFVGIPGQMKKVSSKYCLLAMVFIALFVLNACGQNKTLQPEKNQKMKDTIIKTDDEWRKELSPQQYYVLRQKGTEAPFSGKLLFNKEKGVYKCAACGNELFTDAMKFNSDCGWPSFDNAISGGRIITHVDTSHGMIRTEIICARCGSHLGHLFKDGPTASGLRYCVNSLSLEFVSSKDIAALGEDNKVATNDTITLGGGCFWCVEAIYEMLNGVVKVESGFSGGTTRNPSYEQVCTGITGHAEVVQIVYDTTKTSLDEILKVFFTVHDPTTLNKQGADVGTQYRSVIFYRDDKQYQIAKSIIDSLNSEKVFKSPVLTQLSKFEAFYKAENYHQDYYNQNKDQPYCQLVIRPKIEKFEKVFKDRLKKNTKE